MDWSRFARTTGVVVGAVALLATRALAGEAAPRRLEGEELKSLQQVHDGQWGALAPQNLAKKRPKAPFDMTGTWFVDLSQGFDKFRFGPPYPEFLEGGKEAMKGAAEAAAKGVPYRDTIGQCWPAGMPMIMTRVWPIDFIQLPTRITMIAGFENNVRFIYLDGRKHSSDDEAVPSYNGESIGRWEGKTLVIDTRHFATKNHWIDGGLPVSDEFHMIERVKMIKGGKALEIEYIMTDPKNWKGEWHNTKRFDRLDNTDIQEVHCLPDLNEHIPGTKAGQEELDRREAAGK